MDRLATGISWSARRPKTRPNEMSFGWTDLENGWNHKLFAMEKEFGRFKGRVHFCDFLESLDGFIITDTRTELLTDNVRDVPRAADKNVITLVKLHAEIEEAVHHGVVVFQVVPLLLPRSVLVDNHACRGAARLV